MMIDIQVTTNRAEFNAGLKDIETRLTTTFPGVINSLTAQLKGRIVAKLSGEVLHRHSGKLISSVRTIAASQRESRIVGAVEAAGSHAWYGRVHEKGTTATYLRRTKRGSSRVTVTFPRKSFLRTSTREIRPLMFAMMRQALEMALRG